MSDFMEKLRHLIKGGEGCIDHMYLDTVAKVTVGVGNMLPNVAAAQALPFLLRDSGSSASPSEIAQDFENITEQEPAKVASRYKQYTQLYLPEGAIDDLLDRRIEGFERRLRDDFPDYDGYPESVRLALMDMVFNLGNRGLITKFPSLTRAVRDNDWAECAAQCRRRGIADSRNEEVRNLFLMALG
jgi:hypothetical protein